MAFLNRSPAVIKAPETVSEATKTGAGARVVNPGLSVNRDRQTTRGGVASIQNLSSIPAGRNAVVQAPPVIAVMPDASRAVTAGSIGASREHDEAYDPRVGPQRITVPAPELKYGPQARVVAPRPATASPRVQRAPSGLPANDFHAFKNAVEGILEENARQHKAFANAIADLQAAANETRQLAAQSLNAAKDVNNNLVNLGQNAEAALDKIGQVLVAHEEKLTQIIGSYPETFTSRRQTKPGTPMERNRKVVRTIDSTASQGSALPDAPGISSKNERIANSALNDFYALGPDAEDDAEYEDYD